MYCGKDFSDADVGEDELFWFDFTNDFVTDEAIVSVAWSCEVYYGTDATASACLDGSPGIVAPTKTYHRVNNLKPGVVYRLEAMATTNQSNLISLWSHVECIEPL